MLPSLVFGARGFAPASEVHWDANASTAWFRPELDEGTAAESVHERV